jgi:hypothetical protein
MPLVSHVSDMQTMVGSYVAISADISLNLLQTDLALKCSMVQFIVLRGRGAVRFPNSVQT